MARSPKGEKRLAEANARAVMIAQIATGVLSCLRRGWSPDQVCGFLARRQDPMAKCDKESGWRWRPQ